MKKLFIVIGLLGILCFSAMSGCLDEKSKFIGTWQNQDGSTTMIFGQNQVTITGNGPFGILSLSGTLNYSVANQKITFLSEGTGITLNYSFPQSNQLIISNDQGVSVVFTKK
jgi:hypothetical protein